MERDEPGPGEGSSVPRSESAAVDDVLAGRASYDDLDEAAQARVREAWDRMIAESIESLDLVGRFRAEGRSWSEADADGNLVIRHPD